MILIQDITMYIFSILLVVLLGVFSRVQPAQAQSVCDGPVVRLTGNTIDKYRIKDVADGTTFERTGWYSDTVGNTSGTAFYVGENIPHPNNLCVNNGVINGHIPLEWDWTTTHDYGGSGDRTVFSGLSSINNVRIHNVEDGVKFRERGDEVEYSNVGKWHSSGLYMTAIRDDAVENDDFIPGTVEDSLFDGIWTFYSEQWQTAGPNSTIGPDEDTNVYVNNVLVRLYTTNNNEVGGGKWFKIQGDTPHHQIHISNSIFAVDKEPRHGWGSLDIPAGTTWSGTNYILWLGTPGTYVGPKPSGVIFMEGQQALDKWNESRNSWLTAHGYAPRPEDDLNPMDDPVVAPGEVVTATAEPLPSASSEPWTDFESDFSIWSSHYTQAVSGFLNGDFNSDGIVDGIDYVTMLIHFTL